jgi:tRNA G18 (ribose-2'-O)-methylase SpoU
LLRRRGVFIAENRLVVRALLASARLRVRSVLVTRAALENLRDALEPLEGTLPVYVCDKSLIESISGFNLHRGCLALGERPEALTLERLLAERPHARRLVVLEAITNADNMGGVFRSARAFGVDGAVVGPRCCDPLYRKAIRVSMGASLELPFATASAWPEEIGVMQRAGFHVLALTLAPGGRRLEDVAGGRLPARIAVLAGNEGEGLSAEAQRAADARVTIPMAAGIDSLNVSAAVAIALYRLRAAA